MKKYSNLNAANQENATSKQNGETGLLSSLFGAKEHESVKLSKAIEQRYNVLAPKMQNKSANIVK